MVKSFFQFINKEFNGVNEAALLLGGFALLSQLLGLVRDRLLASFVGAGPMLDVYYAAFRIPDFLYISIASLASVTVLMPFMINKINKIENGKEEARIFLNNVFSVFMVFMLVASIIIVFFMPSLSKLIAPGFSESQLKTLIIVSRIMLLSPFFIGLSNLIGTVTQLFRNFFIFSLSPVFYNIGILIGIIFLYPKFGVYGLAYGVVFGAILHLIIQIPIVYKHNFIPKFVFSINWQDIWQVAKLSLPRTLALSCHSIAFIFLIAMASTLKVGSISLFTFSFNLQSVPVGIIGISYSVAAFPTLVKSFSLKDMDSFIFQTLQASRQIIFWSLPIIALLIVLRAQVVRVILGSNAFTWADTRLTAAAVALFVVSLASQCLVLLFVRGYYATGNTQKPLLINIFSSILIVFLAYFFIYLFKTFPFILSQIENILRVKDVPGTKMLALPMAYTLGSILNFFFIWILFKREFLKNVSSQILLTFIQSFLGALVVGAVTYLSLGFWDDVFGLTTFWGVFLQGFISGIIGIFFGLLVLFLIKNKELLGIIQTLSHKFRQAQIVAPEQSDL
jgi:putative peptidoglycan lipid II flippase